jgi:hypothetical protein
MFPNQYESTMCIYTSKFSVQKGGCALAGAFEGPYPFALMYTQAWTAAAING